jgi:hypothetical protein
MRFGFVAVLLTASVAAQPAAIPQPLTYPQALELARSRNLGLAAARRARAIREAAIKTARLYPNPDLSLDLTQDQPH